MKVLFDLGRNGSIKVMDSKKAGDEPVWRTSRVVCGWF